MNVARNMIAYLQNHPIVGSIAAFTGSGIAFLTNILTDEATIKTIGIMSVYIGFFIGILTGILKLIELYQKIAKKKDIKP